ncbi:Ferrous-iron efflux pump FieF [Sinobacterium norvegicum]|uniref:Ferrous-iron efflux pump FieF n=1 Tax=Sinobacterium norvegicum TaxID=1641715 RepID=A0ABN8ELZ8_9GAMM|nr:cation diffusion facilitator family transporter [Sinobacterium norvegicum]CAH0991121.1 Ferrous-iron efflux pump FieF [Sinobacterium norvegicum]
MTAQREQIIWRVTVVGTVIDAVLSLLKLGVGFTFRSPALIADGIHSLSDLVSDGLILVMAKVAHQDPDKEHPYGHARFETLGTVILGMILFAVGLGMMVEYGTLVYQGALPPAPNALVLTVVAISLVAKEGLYHYTMHFAKQVTSKLLEANAWHSRSDSLSSLVVLLGLAASLAGYPQFELYAALAVAALIVKMGFSLTWGATQELLDHGVDDETISEITAVIEQVPGVKSLHLLRSRLMGHQIFLDAHIQVGWNISASEGHQINEWVMDAVRQQIDNIGDITLHIDSEDDDASDIQLLLPLRAEVEAYIEDYSALSGAMKVTIHYFSNGLHLELLYADQRNDELMRQQSDQLKSDHPLIKAVSLQRVI